jgi:hypothetical protein
MGLCPCFLRAEGHGVRIGTPHTHSPSSSAVQIGRTAKTVSPGPGRTRMVMCDPVRGDKAGKSRNIESPFPRGARTIRGWYVPLAPPPRAFWNENVIITRQQLLADFEQSTHSGGARNVKEGGQTLGLQPYSTSNGHMTSHLTAVGREQGTSLWVENFLTYKSFYTFFNVLRAKCT